MSVILFLTTPYIAQSIWKILLPLLRKERRTRDFKVVICHSHCNEILQVFGYLNMDSLIKLLDVDCCYKGFVQNGNCLNFIRETFELSINKTFNKPSRLNTFYSFCSYCKEIVLNFIKGSHMNEINISFLMQKFLKDAEFSIRWRSREWKSKISPKKFERVWVHHRREKTQL